MRPGLGNLHFRDKKTDQPATPDKPEIALSNLVQIFPKVNSAVGEHLKQNCWRPSTLKKYILDAEIVALEKRRLFDLDSHEKIQAIARQMKSFCGSESAEVK